MPATQYSAIPHHAKSQPTGSAMRDNVLSALSLQDESRAHLELNKRTSKGSLGVRLSRSWAEEELRRDVDKRNDALSLQGERKLAFLKWGWVDLVSSVPQVSCRRHLTGFYRRVSA